MAIDIKQKDITIDDTNIIKELYGIFDRNIRIIEKELEVNINLKEGTLKVSGATDNVNLVDKLIPKLIKIIEEKKILKVQDVRYSIDSLISSKDKNIKDLLNCEVGRTASGKPVKPKTWGQKRYIDSMYENDVVFGIGPAGTGKTYLAMAMAIQALRNKEVQRIILTRPAVEAGENLGFLPGDLQEKVDPYLRPIYDALFDILGINLYEKYVERGLIEVAPLAYMRGRTLESAYIILDEAQNTTNEQMKMLLTRIGIGSKLVVTGDITQIDLKKNQDSGLKTAENILKEVEGIDFIYLSNKDIVRHHIVQKIVEAYEKHENR